MEATQLLLGLIHETAGLSLSRLIEPALIVRQSTTIPNRT
jgi:hypothetical protein